MTKNQFEKKYIKFILKYIVNHYLSGLFFSKKKKVQCSIFSFMNESDKIYVTLIHLGGSKC
jgi:hypothetical protein